MKVVLFNGSPRKGGNTETLLREVMKVLESEGIETELVQLGGTNIHGCIACQGCFRTKDKQCVVKDDIANECMTKAFEADGIILGSPTYFADMTPETKAFIDRMGFVSFANDGLLARKAGAAVVAVRRGGAVHVFDSINHVFQMSQMFVVGSTYWNIGFGLGKGEVTSDDEGIANMQNLGENMAWLLKKINQ